MIIGHHFKKHKPEWNFFTSQYQQFIDKSSHIVFKIILMSFAVQILFFLPVIYWTFQNYNVLQALIPKSYDLTVNFDFEKKWIVFLVFSSVLISSVWNAFIWYNFYKFKNLSQQIKTNDLSESRDEVDDLRLVS